MMGPVCCIARSINMRGKEIFGDFKAYSVLENQTRWDYLPKISMLICGVNLIINISLNLVGTCVSRVEMSNVQFFENKGGGMYGMVDYVCNCCNNRSWLHIAKSQANWSTLWCNSPRWIGCTKACLAVNSYVHHQSNPSRVGSIKACIPAEGGVGSVCYHWMEQLSRGLQYCI